MHLFTTRHPHGHVAFVLAWFTLEFRRLSRRRRCINFHNPRCGQRLPQYHLLGTWSACWCPLLRPARFAGPAVETQAVQPTLGPTAQRGPGPRPRHCFTNSAATIAIVEFETFACLSEPPQCYYSSTGDLKVSLTLPGADDDAWCPPPFLPGGFPPNSVAHWIEKCLKCEDS